MGYDHGPKSPETDESSRRAPRHKSSKRSDAAVRAVELVDVETLVPHPQNPRRGDLDVIAASIRANGWYGTLVVQTSTRFILVGNHRYLAATKIVGGFDQLPVYWVDVDEVTARRIMLADNRSTDLAVNDEAQLLELLRTIDEDDLAAIGYDIADVSELVSRLDGETLDDVVPTAPLAYDIFDQETIRERAFTHYREHGFPLRSLPVHESMQEINALASLDQSKLMGTTLGYGVADTYQPHRFSVQVVERVRAVDAFDRDNRLREALDLTLQQSRRLSDGLLLSTLGYVRNAQVASNFRPGFALQLYRRFAFDGADVLDTSTGYGGRLVGFLASTCGHYVGIDPCLQTCQGNQQMVDDLDMSERVTLINQPAEDVELQAESVDFAFTSPPYFSKEHYSDEPTQSYLRYSTGEAWRDGFLVPMLALTFAALRPERMCAINVADIKLSGTTYPLVQWTTDAALAAGFVHSRTERYALSRVPGRGEKLDSYEPLLLFTKP